MGVNEKLAIADRNFHCEMRETMDEETTGTWLGWWEGARVMGQG